MDVSEKKFDINLLFKNSSVGYYYEYIIEEIFKIKDEIFSSSKDKAGRIYEILENPRPEERWEEIGKLQLDLIKNIREYSLILESQLCFEQVLFQYGLLDIPTNSYNNEVFDLKRLTYGTMEVSSKPLIVLISIAKGATKQDVARVDVDEFIEIDDKSPKIIAAYENYRLLESIVDKSIKAVEDLVMLTSKITPRKMSHKLDEEVVIFSEAIERVIDVLILNPHSKKVLDIFKPYTSSILYPKSNSRVDSLEVSRIEDLGRVLLEQFPNLVCKKWLDKLASMKEEEKKLLYVPLACDFMGLDMTDDSGKEDARSWRRALMEVTLKLIYTKRAREMLAMLDPSIGPFAISMKKDKKGKNDFFIEIEQMQHTLSRQVLGVHTEESRQDPHELPPQPRPVGRHTKKEEARRMIAELTGATGGGRKGKRAARSGPKSQSAKPRNSGRGRR